MIPLLAILGVTGAAYAIKKRQKPPPKGMTPERQVIYERALLNLKEPEKLRTLAEAFEKQGLAAQADMLFKRAALRELPKEVKESRKKIFKDAMKSKDPAVIRKIAGAFSQQGAVGAAAALEEVAKGLEG